MKGQGRDQNIFRVQYLEKGWRYEHGHNGARIGAVVWESNGHVTDDVK